MSDGVNAVVDCYKRRCGEGMTKDEIRETLRELKNSDLQEYLRLNCPECTHDKRRKTDNVQYVTGHLMSDKNNEQPDFLKIPTDLPDDLFETSLLNLSFGDITKLCSSHSDLEKYCNFGVKSMFNEPFWRRYFTHGDNNEQVGPLFVKAIQASVEGGPNNMVLIRFLEDLQVVYDKDTNALISELFGSNVFHTLSKAMQRYIIDDIPSNRFQDWTSYTKRERMSFLLKRDSMISLSHSIQIYLFELPDDCFSDRNGYTKRESMYLLLDGGTFKDLSQSIQMYLFDLPEDRFLDGFGNSRREQMSFLLDGGTFKDLSHSIQMYLLDLPDDRFSDFFDYSKQEKLSFLLDGGTFKDLSQSIQMYLIDLSEDRFSDRVRFSKHERLLALRRSSYFERLPVRIRSYLSRYFTEKKVVSFRMFKM
jgi:hypothetical protein